MDSSSHNGMIGLFNYTIQCQNSAHTNNLIYYSNLLEWYGVGLKKFMCMMNIVKAYKPLWYITTIQVLYQFILLKITLL